MRVLSLDLDFFLTQRIVEPDNAARPSACDAQPWSPDDVREFLEERCRLDRARPVRGKCVVQHCELYRELRQLVERDELTTPFELVHIDAHSDLGLGGMASPYTYIETDLLARPAGERCYPSCGANQLNEGSWLAFAVAARWLSSIDFVLHQDWRNDLPIGIVSGFDDTPAPTSPVKCSVQLCRLSVAQASEIARRRTPRHEVNPGGLEPSVPLTLTPQRCYEERCSLDFVFLCLSPRYTPSSADALVPVIREYMGSS